MSYDPIVDRVVQMKPDGKVVRFIKGHIDSTDEKPTDGIYEGSSLFERDTGKTFNWSEKLNKWVVPDDIPGGSGGGSSGGGSGEILPAMTSITWAELKSARDNGTLVPGMQYRITDYICTTDPNYEDIRAVSHPFDIIVTADSENVLNENARACLHEGDTYYSGSVPGSDLSAWELKYCIDNDCPFSHGDLENGRGWIYYMKDEHRNECEYDFKQIQFKRYTINADDVGLVNYYATLNPDPLITEIDENDFMWFYTFSYMNGFGATEVTDATMNLYGEDNRYPLALDNKIYGFDNVFCTMSPYDMIAVNTIGVGSISNTFFGSCRYNVLGSGCSSNVFGPGCEGNIINTGACVIFSGGSRNNRVGYSCGDIGFKSGSNDNTVGNDCTGIIFGNGASFYTVMSGTQINPESMLNLNNTQSCTKIVGKNSSNVVKTWIPADLVT